jgi:hypothetical protein
LTSLVIAAGADADQPEGAAKVLEHVAPEQAFPHVAPPRSPAHAPPYTLAPIAAT